LLAPKASFDSTAVEFDPESLQSWFSFAPLRNRVAEWCFAAFFLNQMRRRSPTRVCDLQGLPTKKGWLAFCVMMALKPRELPRYSEFRNDGECMPLEVAHLHEDRIDSVAGILVQAFPTDPPVGFRTRQSARDSCLRS